MGAFTGKNQLVDEEKKIKTATRKDKYDENIQMAN